MIIKPFKDAPLEIDFDIYSNLPKIYKVENSRELTIEEENLLIKNITEITNKMYGRQLNKKNINIFFSWLTDNLPNQKDTGFIGWLFGNTDNYKEMPLEQVNRINETIYRIVRDTYHYDPQEEAIISYMELLRIRRLQTAMKNNYEFKKYIEKDKQHMEENKKLLDTYLVLKEKRNETL